jgi:hypothetical protein
VDSDTVVILASLLCALICVAGLALVARCACRRGGGGGGGASVSVAAATALAAIEALPTVSVSSSLKARTREDDKECAICLAAFAEGDQLRVLPRCAHGFHAACVDTWLAAHASCPSCRATIVSVVSPPPLCRRCGAACCGLQDAMAAPEPAAAAAAAGGLLAPRSIDGASLSSSTSIH